MIFNILINIYIINSRLIEHPMKEIPSSILELPSLKKL